MILQVSKHLGILLDSKLPFEEHCKTILSKTNRTIGLLCKLQSLLPREALITIYKAFVRPHLDYGDVLYDQVFKASFYEKLESIQYIACLALTGAIRVTSKEKIYQELGNVLKFIRPSSNSIFDCHNPIGIKYITRIRLGLSHLREHKFKHSFQYTLNPICNCGNDVEFVIYFSSTVPCIVMNVADS